MNPRQIEKTLGGNITICEIQKIKLPTLAIFGERLQRVEFVGPNNIRLENLRTLRIVKSVPKCEGRISNYIMREVLRNVFPSLLDFGFDGDMIEIDDQDEQDDVGRRLIWKSSTGI